MEATPVLTTSQEVALLFLVAYGSASARRVATELRDDGLPAAGVLESLLGLGLVESKTDSRPGGRQRTRWSATPAGDRVATTF